LTNELSRLYLKKDKNKCWRKWHATFHDCDSDVAYLLIIVLIIMVLLILSETFSSVYFDSYMDDSEFTRCLQRLQSSITANDCQYDNFDVSAGAWILCDFLGPDPPTF